MTGHAIVRKSGSSVFDVVWRFRERILGTFATNGKGVLNPGDGGRFPFSGWSGSAPGKGNSETEVKQGGVDTHEAGYSTT
jgi:hypothetical protein